MRGWLADIAALLATGLRGMRARRLLTVGSVLVAALAIAAAVVGPMYQSASAASFVVTKLRAEPDYITGVTLDYTRQSRLGSADVYAQARSAVAGTAPRGFERPALSLWSTRLAVPSISDVPGGRTQARLVTAPGSCQQLLVSGRCPQRPGEILLLRSDADYTNLGPGDQVMADTLSQALTVVGTYRLPTGGNGLFDAARFASVLPQPTGMGYTAYAPAPFVAARSTLAGLPAGSWLVRMDYRLPVPASTSVGDLQAAAAEVSRLPGVLRSAKTTGSLSPELGNALKAVVREVDARRATAQQTVAPAVASLVLVALVLLVRLLSAATDLRRPELALASLRGVDRRLLWTLALVEPVLIIAVAVPVGAAGGYLAGRELAATWLVRGLPARLGPTSLWWAAVVLVASVVVAVIAVRAAVREPLSVQIAAVRRPAASSRWMLVTRAALFAATVAALAVTWSAGGQSDPNVLDLLLPILLALSAGQLLTYAAALAARWWARRSASHRGTAGYVAARTIARRREGTWVILPLTAALAISVFGAGIYSAAGAWRASDAATMVGADAAYRANTSLSQAVALTHQLDPFGRWLMATGVDDDILEPKVILDAPRLARVAAWPSTWTPGVTADQVGAELSPGRPPLTLTGHRLALTVTNSVAGDAPRLLLDVDILTPKREVSHVYIGSYPRGTATRSATMPCAGGCSVTGLGISAPSTSGAVMRGTLTIGTARVDGSPLPYFARIGWRGMTNPAYVYGGPVVQRAQVVGSSLRVELDSAGNQVVATLKSTDLPPATPVLLGTAARAVSRDTKSVVQPVGTTESMPFLGPIGWLTDYTAYIRYNTQVGPATRVYILARSDTPASVLDQLAAHGINERSTLAQARSTLDQDPYALALNLYLVVTGIVILLALASLVVNTAVQLPARRRDAASLRVVGVRRRSILAAATSEFTAVLSTAAVAGILAGALAEYVVVRTITLGYADSLFTPRVLPTLDAGSLAKLSAEVLVALLALAVVLGGLTIRGAHAATLRESAT